MSAFSSTTRKWDDPARNSAEYRAAVNSLLDAYQPEITPSRTYQQNSVICTPSGVAPLRYLPSNTSNNSSIMNSNISNRSFKSTPLSQGQSILNNSPNTSPDLPRLLIDSLPKQENHKQTQLLPSFQNLSVSTENDLSKNPSSFSFKTPVSNNKPPIFDHEKLSSTKKSAEKLMTPSPNTSKYPPPLPSPLVDQCETPHVSSKHTPSAVFSGWSSGSKSVHFPEKTPVSAKYQTPIASSEPNSAFKNPNSIPLTYSAVKTPPVQKGWSPIPLQTPSDHATPQSTDKSFADVPPPSALEAFFQSRSATLSSPVFSTAPKRRKPKASETPDISVDPKANISSKHAQLPEGILPELISEVPFSAHYGFEEAIEIDCSYRPSRVPLPYAIQVYTVDEGGPYRPVSATLEQDSDSTNNALVSIIYENVEFEPCNFNDDENSPDHFDASSLNSADENQLSEDALLIFWAAPDEQPLICTSSLLLTVTDSDGQIHEVPIQLQFSPTKPIITVSPCTTRDQIEGTETTIAFDSSQSTSERQVTITNETEGDAPVFFNVFLGDSAGDLFSLEDESGLHGDCIPVLLHGGASYNLRVHFQMNPEVTIRSAYYGHALIRFASFSKLAPGQDRDLHQFYDNVLNLEAYNFGDEQDSSYEVGVNASVDFDRNEKHECMEKTSLHARKPCDFYCDDDYRNKEVAASSNDNRNGHRSPKLRAAQTADDGLLPLPLYVPSNSVEPMPQEVEEAPYMLCEFRLSGSPRWMKQQEPGHVDDLDLIQGHDDRPVHEDEVQEEASIKEDDYTDNVPNSGIGHPETLQQAGLGLNNESVRKSNASSREETSSNDAQNVGYQVAPEDPHDALSANTASPDLSPKIQPISNIFESTQEHKSALQPPAPIEPAIPSGVIAGERRLTDSQKFFISLLGNDGKMKPNTHQQCPDNKDAVNQTFKESLQHRQVSAFLSDENADNQLTNNYNVSSVTRNEQRDAQDLNVPSTIAISSSFIETSPGQVRKSMSAPAPEEGLKLSELRKQHGIDSISQHQNALELSVSPKRVENEASSSLSLVHHQGSRKAASLGTQNEKNTIDFLKSSDKTINESTELTLKQKRKPNEGPVGRLGSFLSTGSESSKSTKQKNKIGRVFNTFREIVTPTKTSSAAPKNSKPRIKISRQVANKGIRIGPTAGSAVFSFMNSWNEMLEVEVSIKKRRATRASAHVTNEYMVLKPNQKTKVVIERKSSEEGDLLVNLKCSSTVDGQIFRNYRFPLRIEASKNRVPPARGFTIDRPTLSFYNSQGTNRVCNVRVLNGTKSAVPYKAWFTGYDESKDSMEAFDFEGEHEGVAKPEECISLTVHFKGSDPTQFFRAKLNITMDNERSDFIPIFGYAGGSDVKFEPAPNRRLRASNMGSRYGFVLITGPEYFSEETESHKAVLRPGEVREFDLPYGSGSHIFTGDEVARSRMCRSHEIYGSHKTEHQEDDGIFLGHFEGQEEAEESENLNWEVDDRHSLYYAGRLLDNNVRRYAFQSSPDGSIRLCEQANQECSWHASVDGSGFVHLENLDGSEDLKYEAEGTEPSRGVIPPLSDAKLARFGDLVRVTARGRTKDLSST